MSTNSWAGAQRDRPITDHERRAAFTMIAVLSIAAGLLLALTTPGEPSGSSRHSVAARRHQQATGTFGQESERAAEVFLASYLPYLYGRAAASEVRGTTSEFAHSLTPRAPRVPPAMRRRHPRVVLLSAATAPAGLIGVTALVNDGGLVDYPITLLLSRHGHRLFVAGMAGT